jgi:hypothetical protein
LLRYVRVIVGIRTVGIQTLDDFFMSEVSCQLFMMRQPSYTE